MKRKKIKPMFTKQELDADFDRYAVQVQNGEGYYDASGTYQSYYKNLDEY